MDEWSEEELPMLNIALANLGRLNFFGKLREELLDIESFDLTEDEGKGEERIIKDIRTRRAKLDLLHELQGYVVRAQNTINEERI